MPVRAPIKIPLNRYRGSDARRRRRISEHASVARQIESHINSSTDPEVARLFTYGDIAIDLSLDPELVHDLLYSLDGGDTGIVVWGVHFVDPFPPKQAG